ncbi:MAG TPA: DNA primase [Anaeromyxobacteraceae bacterium]|nr:DNA primase [Anaeromyxobacteraceae bacterium]
MPDEVIEEIRGRVDTVAVIGRHIELKRSGRTWKGCCPFHGERTPSFHVYPEDRHFKCYGCGEYGDVFKFLQKLQGKEFPDVVRALAAEVGVEIPERAEDGAEQRRRRQERNEILAALDAAARYFAARLWSSHGDEGHRYLAGRGISDEVARRFRLGIASTDWQDLSKRLPPKGIRPASLVTSGLVAERDRGEPYDRFRGRLMFPISGLDGEVIGFGGRVMPGAGDKLAKYINSPESPVYKKSRVLYGIDLARESIRRTRTAILVEGYFDVIGLHQAGIMNAVAVCGTALTPEHVDLLKRCDCREIVLLFDGDAAGLAGPARAAEALLPSGLSGKVAVLPSDAGKVDPDEYAREKGAAGVEALVSAAPTLTEFLIEQVVARESALHPPDTLEQKLAAFRALKPFISLAPEGLARTVFEERVAKRLGVDAAVLAAEVEKPATSRFAPRRQPQAMTPAREAERAQPARAQQPPPGAGQGVRRASKLWGPAVDALGLLAAFPDVADVAREEHLLGLFPPGPLADVVRDVLEHRVAGDQVLARLDAVVDAASRARVEKLLGPARPDPTTAEREIRRAILRAKVELLEGEHARLNAEVARKGSPVPEELRAESLRTWHRLVDLKKRLAAL